MTIRRRRLAKLYHLSWQDRWLLAESYVLLGLARLAINLVPLRRLAPWFGSQSQETPAEITPANLHEAERIAWAVRTASHHTPWQSNCYPQAFTAKLLLRRKQIPSTLYLGAALHPNTAGQTVATPAMTAHAWLRCGPLYVTGGRGQDTYTVLAVFGA